VCGSHGCGNVHVGRSVFTHVHTHKPVVCAIVRIHIVPVYFSPNSLITRL